MDDFVSQVGDVARRAAMTTLERALGGRSRGALGGRSRGPARARPSLGGKRTESEITSLATKVIGFVAKNPGLRIEQINKQLGTAPKELSLPIRKLIADGALKTKGSRRSTTYYAGTRS